ncbi:HvfC/BufC N-terminal domain-containing protein [Pseudoalteromonas aurantia]|uniref:Putative DNA-binding domain-containing protein n=1 Tax=Pseudoalteromonas aurantia 208 TaxID=1314867 RepID=A0ABR9EAX0_9GAMM|nr:DNA-binding domain-containing protein [Pseudoalteromonas aurantia]MBE0367519.1 hypothetical protein [Pseudoalteromonas aurantia 208]
MSDLATLQHAFIALLHNENNSLANNIVDQAPLEVCQRLEIYQSAYRIRLRGVLEQDHETLGFYLGDELFEAMMDGYINYYPSQSRSLRQFGERLPEFLRITPPFSEHGILAEIAEFERILLSSFDSGDASLLRWPQLQAIDINQWPNMVLQLHPSVYFFKCAYASVESWRALKEKKTPPLADIHEPHHWLIARGTDHRTGFHPLDKKQWLCLKSIADGMPFSMVCQSIVGEFDDEQTCSMFVIGVLQLGIEQGWFSGVNMLHGTLV